MAIYLSEDRLKIHRNNKLAGCLLIASGLMFFVSAAMMGRPAFSAVGIALLVVGASVLRKKQK
jgi:membrane-bound ClpP family serine protease